MAQQSILIIGGGSIGKRHLRNLRALGETDILVVEVNPERATEIAKEFSVMTYPSLEAAFEQNKFSIAVVASPSVYHLEQALFCAEKNCHLFVEKPLSHSYDGVDNLIKLVNEKKLVTMVGSNWKFYPSFQKIKELLEAKKIGRVLSARCQFGQYLPDWHPWEDYRRGYSANKKLGGGVLLDSHEFDYLTWFMDEPVKKIACLADKVSGLDIDTEDAVEVIMQFASGAIAELHFDYLQRFYRRNFEFFGEIGTISWDVREKKVLLESKEKGIEEYPLEASYDINTMYIEQMKYFLACVRKGEQTMTPVEYGAKVLRLIVAAKESAEKERFVQL